MILIAVPLWGSAARGSLTGNRGGGLLPAPWSGTMCRWERSCKNTFLRRIQWRWRSWRAARPWANPWQGPALRCTQVVLFQFGAGISSGVVIDGRIFGGKYCAGARLGHCTIVSGGKTCTCGRKGCFEAYASLEALAEQAREAAARYKNTLLGRYDALTISPSEVMDCARKGDRAARRVISQYIDYVSDGIVNAVNAFRPEIVVLGGTEVKFWKELLDEINSRCCERYYGAALLPVPKVVLASLGVDAGLIGAGGLTISIFYTEKLMTTLRDSSTLAAIWSASSN